MDKRCEVHGTRPTTLDAVGNAWCEQCSHRKALIDWGYAQGWPEVFVAPYAIGNDASLWKTNALLAREECIHTLVNGLMGANSDEGVA